MKILVAVDATEASHAAAQEAVSREWPPETEIRLLEAVGVIDAAADEVFEPEFVPSKAERAKRLLAEEAQELGRSRMKLSTTVAAGRAGRAIVGCAQRWSADFVFLAHSDRHDGARRGLGRTAREVVRDAPCSVCVVRPRPAAALGRAERRILIAIDGAPASLRAARSVASRSWPAGTRVAVLAATQERASETRRILEGARLDVESARADPEPGKHLVEASETFGADLIVVGFEKPHRALEAAELAPSTLEVIR